HPVGGGCRWTDLGGRGRSRRSGLRGQLRAPDHRRRRAQRSRAPPLPARLLRPRVGQRGQAAPARLLAALRRRAAPPTMRATLAENTTYFGNRAAPVAGTDAADQDGIVYRFFPGHGFQFHPLANAGALNSAVAAKDVDRAGTLATALLARASVGPGGALRWEYEFPYGGGKPPWPSGMAQAVMAQAFA